MSNTITFELCAEDRARLDRLTAALEGMRIPEVTLTGADIPLNPCTALPEVPAPAEDKPAHVEDKPAPVEEKKPTVTIDEVRALVQKLVAPGSAKKEAAKAIVKSYGTKVSDIPADKYDEALARLTALAEEG